ncbi:hypothetical protein VTJ04DRAFT_6062 [Mycothermus thermophilus]|uniref:uncharacterized protein n=1 Tax=Humicola insolens TaxID=85995 RepID=UPI0037432AFC
MAPFIFDDDRRSIGQSSNAADDSPTIPSNLGDTGPLSPPTNLTSEPLQPAPAHPSPDTTRDHVEDISVALEWKLLFPLLSRGSTDPQPSDPRPIITACTDDAGSPGDQARLEQVHELVAQTIREAGERAVTAHALRQDGAEEKDVWATAWVVKKANSAEPLTEEAQLASRGYVWVPVEICSPRMRFCEARTRARMCAVLEALRASHRLAANASCEVHVHLGRMDGRAWTLSTLQRLGSMLWLAEPALRSIRDPNSPNFANVYTWGFAMREQSRLALLVAKDVSMAAATHLIPDQQISEAVRAHPTAASKDVAALVAIWRKTSHLDLGRLLSGPERKYRRLGFNFSAFGEEDERAMRNPRTMEFRMMDGSVDTELIAGWLTICGTIVATAVADGDPRYGTAFSLLLSRTAPQRTQAGLQETEGNRLAREFGELMQALGIDGQHYRGFQEKIRREH